MLSYDPEKPVFSLHIPKTAGSSFGAVLAQWFNSFDFPNLEQRPRLASILHPFQIDLLLQRVLKCSLYYHYSDHRKSVSPRTYSLGKGYGLFLNEHRKECVHGHFDKERDGGTLFDLYPDASQFITVLRDPLKMEISLYNYQKMLIDQGQLFWEGRKINNLEPIDEWLENRGSYMTYFLPWEFTKNNFRTIIESNFIHIGVVENLQLSVDILATKLGFPKVQVPVINESRFYQSPSAEAIRKFKRDHELDYEIYDYARSLNVL